MSYYDKIEMLLKLVDQKTHVRFAIFCAEDVACNLDKDTKDTSLAAIKAAKVWLADPTEANKKAANAAHSANSAAYSAAYSAHSAAYSAYSANAAYSAAYSAAHSAAHSAKREEKFKYQFHYLVSISNITKLEKLIYNINQGENA